MEGLFGIGSRGWCRCGPLAGSPWGGAWGLGEVLGVFSALGRGDLVNVPGAGFFFSVRGGDVVTDFITVRVGVVCFPFASARGGVMGVDFFTGAFEEVLEVIAFFRSARGGEAGGDVVFTVSGCFPRRAVVVVTGLAIEDAACVFLTVNGAA